MAKKKNNGQYITKQPGDAAEEESTFPALYILPCAAGV